MSPWWLPLLPVLAAQGLLVRASALRLPEPPGERSGVEGAGERLRLLVLGDSAAAGVGAPHQRFALAGQLVAELARDHEVHWRLHARTGHTVADATAALAAIDGERFDVAVTSIGVNDATRRRAPDDFAARVARLADILRTRHGTRMVIVSGLPPVHRFPALPQPLRAFLGGHARRLDDTLAALAARRDDLLHVPLDFGDAFTAAAMAEDGFHPGPPAYRAWAQHLAPRVRAAFALAAPGGAPA
jgi:lysophospholipase L1-like esterase